LIELRDRLVSKIDSGFEEVDAIIPVSDQKSIAYIRKVAEVLEEQYTWGQIPYEGQTLGVVRLRYRVAPRYSDDLAALTIRYRDFQLVEEDTQPV